MPMHCRVLGKPIVEPNSYVLALAKFEQRRESAPRASALQQAFPKTVLPGYSRWVVQKVDEGVALPGAHYRPLAARPSCRRRRCLRRSRRASRPSRRGRSGKHRQWLRAAMPEGSISLSSLFASARFRESFSCSRCCSLHALWMSDAVEKIARSLQRCNGLYNDGVGAASVQARRLFAIAPVAASMPPILTSLACSWSVLVLQSNCLRTLVASAARSLRRHRSAVMCQCDRFRNPLRLRGAPLGELRIDAVLRGQRLGRVALPLHRGNVRPHS